MIINTEVLLKALNADLAETESWLTAAAPYAPAQARTDLVRYQELKGALARLEVYANHHQAQLPCDHGYPNVDWTGSGVTCRRCRAAAAEAKAYKAAFDGQRGIVPIGAPKLTGTDRGA